MAVVVSAHKSLNKESDFFNSSSSQSVFSIRLLKNGWKHDNDCKFAGQAIQFLLSKKGFNVTCCKFRYFLIRCSEKVSCHITVSHACGFMQVAFFHLQKTTGNVMLFIGSGSFLVPLFCVVT